MLLNREEYKKLIDLERSVKIVINKNQKGGNHKINIYNRRILLPFVTCSRSFLCSFLHSYFSLINFFLMPVLSQLFNFFTNAPLLLCIRITLIEKFQNTHSSPPPSSQLTINYIPLFHHISLSSLANHRRNKSSNWPLSYLHYPLYAVGLYVYLSVIRFQQSHSMSAIIIHNTTRGQLKIENAPYVAAFKSYSVQC